MGGGDDMKSSRSPCPQPGPPPRQQPPGTGDTWGRHLPGEGSGNVLGRQTGQHGPAWDVANRSSLRPAGIPGSAPAPQGSPSHLPGGRGDAPSRAWGTGSLCWCLVSPPGLLHAVPPASPASDGDGLPRMSPRGGSPDQNGLWGKGLRRPPMRQQGKSPRLGQGQRQQVPVAGMSVPPCIPGDTDNPPSTAGPRSEELTLPLSLLVTRAGHQGRGGGYGTEK